MLIRIAFFAALGGFLFGYDLGLIGGALLGFSEDLDIHSSLVQETIVGALKFGAFFGTFLGGALMLRYGRRLAIAATSVAGLLGPLLMASAFNSIGLIVGRVVSGLGIGASAIVAPAYLAELAPAQHRGAMVQVYEVMLCTGMLISTVVDWALQHEGSQGWRWMVGLPAIPGAAIGLALLLLPESPRWLVMQDRLDEALATLQDTMRGSELLRGAMLLGSRSVPKLSPERLLAEAEDELLLLWSSVEKDRASVMACRAQLLAKRRHRAASGDAAAHSQALQQPQAQEVGQEPLLTRWGSSSDRAPPPRSDKDGAGQDGSAYVSLADLMGSAAASAAASAAGQPAGVAAPGRAGTPGLGGGMRSPAEAEGPAQHARRARQLQEQRKALGHQPLLGSLGAVGGSSAGAYGASAPWGVHPQQPLASPQQQQHSGGDVVLVSQGGHVVASSTLPTALTAAQAAPASVFTLLDDEEVAHQERGLELEEEGPQRLQHLPVHSTTVPGWGGNPWQQQHSGSSAHGAGGGRGVAEAWESQGQEAGLEVEREGLRFGQVAPAADVVAPQGMGASPFHGQQHWLPSHWQQQQQPQEVLFPSLPSPPPSTPPLMDASAAGMAERVPLNCSDAAAGLSGGGLAAAWAPRGEDELEPGRERNFGRTLVAMLWDIRAVLQGPESRACIVAMVLAVFNQATASTAIINFAPVLLRRVGSLSRGGAMAYTIVIALTKVVGVCIGLVMVDVLGRRPLLIWGALGCAFSMALATGSAAAGIAPALLLCMCLFILAFSVSWAGVYWVVVAEVFSMAAKSPASSAATSLLFLSGSLTNMVFLVLVDWLGAGTFLVFAGVALASAAYVYVMLPETKGRALAEVQELMRQGPSGILSWRGAGALNSSSSKEGVGNSGLHVVDCASSA